MASIEVRTGIEPRRADFVLTYLRDAGLSNALTERRPARVSYRDLARVHGDDLLESLAQPDMLSRVFGVDPADVHVDETMLTVRLACGATMAAAREALDTHGPMLNLLGGFHHAEPDRPGPLCPFNDIAVAVAALRHDGFAGRIVILDLDAHPPDGTAACLRGDDAVWIGSLSGSDWGPLAGVDETVLRARSDDGEYARALAGLLERMPLAQLAFVIAGGDVLDGDRLGNLGLTLEGARKRDLAVASALESIGSVWLPGGGYHPDAWKVLAGTALAIGSGSRAPIAVDYDGIRERYARIAATLDPDALRMARDLEEEILADLGVKPRGLLNYYSRSGVEHALERYGILTHLRRLGYGQFEVELQSRDNCDRAQLFGHHDGSRHLLIECLLERRRIADRPVLFVHWLTLQDAGRKQAAPSKLPGQEHPGLGLAKEIGELFARMAERLGLAGVAFTPSWYHTAYAARHRCHFLDAARQGRFEALVRDMHDIPLAEATRAVAEGRVLMNGNAYQWEADDMVGWNDGSEPDPAAVQAERDRTHYSVRARAA